MNGILDAPLHPSVGIAELTLQSLEIAENDGEQIVEVVGHAACQLTDGIEPLRLPQRLFRGRFRCVSGLTMRFKMKYS